MKRTLRQDFRRIEGRGLDDEVEARHFLLPSDLPMNGRLLLFGRSTQKDARLLARKDDESTRRLNLHAMDERFRTRKAHVARERNVIRLAYELQRRLVYMQRLRLDLVGKHALGQECDIVHRIDIFPLELQFLSFFRDLSLDSERCALAAGLGFDRDGRLVREVKLRPDIFQSDFLARNGNVRLSFLHADLAAKIIFPCFLLHEVGDIPASVRALLQGKGRLYDRHMGNRSDRR